MNKHEQLRLGMRRLQRSMDYIAGHPALDKSGREGRQLAEIYQQLGYAWELLALKCGHRAGWRRFKDGRQACKVCGTFKNAREAWLLLPSTGPKLIGRKSRPTTRKIMPTRKAATVLKDVIRFHGAKLSIEVLNPHKSGILRLPDINVAADRLVELHESGMVCRFDDHTFSFRTGIRPRGSKPPYGAFLSELSRKALARFPVLVEYDDRGRFRGLVVFREPSRRTR